MLSPAPLFSADAALFSPRTLYLCLPCLPIPLHKVKGQATEGHGYERKASHQRHMLEKCKPVKPKVASIISCPITLHIKKTCYQSNYGTQFSYHLLRELLSLTETDLIYLKHTQKAKYAQNKYILRISLHSRV